MEQTTQFTQLGLFTTKAPRYTSYPTSVHFRDDVGSAQMTQWISEIPENSEISLYIHIPFCRRLCWFCACRTQGTSTLSPVEAYIQHLEAELDLLAQTLPRGVSLSHLHWGGGTPTLLSADLIRRLGTAIKSSVPFSKDIEFSVEIDPNEIDQGRAQALHDIGMTRASIGIQDFDPEIQKIIGREQSFEVTQTAVNLLRSVGITSLNADLLFGLPNQTPKKITETLQKLLSISPDRIALYGYAHVPWMAKRQNLIPTETLPTPQQRLSLFLTAQNILQWDGYQSIGIDHFARPSDAMAIATNEKMLRRNFQGYTTDTSEVLIGLGASSISKFPQGYAQNAPSTSKYIQAIQEGTFATSRGHELRPHDKIRARMIEMLMCDFEIRNETLAEEFDLDPNDTTALFEQVNTKFNFLLEVSEAGLTVPMAARPLTRMIAREFDEFEVTENSHSHAI